MSLNEDQRRALQQELQAAKQQTMDWFREARYGMFIHWGVYSQLGGVYQGKRMEEGRRPRVAEWIMHAFNIPRAEYRGLAASFNPDKFNAAEWVSLAKAAGMRYMVLTAKHHEGFALFDSAHSDFNSVAGAPCQRDFVRELYEECQRQDLPFGLYYSHSIDWMDGGDGGQKDYSAQAERKIGLHAYNEWDPAPISYDDYLDNKALPQVRELLIRFPNLKLFWFDVAYFIPESRSFAFYEAVSRLSPKTLISERVGNDYGDYLIPGDNVIPDKTLDAVWETVGTLNNSWGFKSYDHDWKSPAEVLLWIIDIISKGGNYMLNIGPRGDGSVPEESVRILREVGAWLKPHQEAIHGTGPWTVSHVGPTPLKMAGTDARERSGFQSRFTPEDQWFTCRGDTIYVFSLVTTLPERLVIERINPDSVLEVSHMASGRTVSFQALNDALILNTDETRSQALAHVFCVRCRESSLKESGSGSRSPGT